MYVFYKLRANLTLMNEDLNQVQGPGEPAAETPDERNYLSFEERQEYLKLNIPNWVKLFGAGVAVIFIISVIKLPKNLSVGIHLARAEKAIKAQKYKTAQHEAATVLKILPDNKKALSDLMIASFYNGDLSTFIACSNALEGVDFEKDEMDTYYTLELLMKKADLMMPSDSLYHISRVYDSLNLVMPDSTWKNYLSHFPDDAQANTIYASRLMDADNYTEAAHYVQLALNKQFDYLPALMYASSIYRQMDSCELSLKYCNQMLEMNKEHVYALSSKARTLLKQKKDKEALELALTSYDLDNEDVYSAATLAMANHFNNKIADRDKIINKYKNDSLAMSTMKYAIDVINQKEHFRN